MKVEVKQLIIALLSLLITLVIGIAVNFNTKLWIMFGGIYLVGTLIGTFFGAYTLEILNKKEEQDKLSNTRE